MKKGRWKMGNLEKEMQFITKNLGFIMMRYYSSLHCTEGCMGEQASLEFDLTFGDVLLHKLVKNY